MSSASSHSLEYDYKPKHEGLGRFEDDVQDNLLEAASERRYGKTPSEIDPTEFDIQPEAPFVFSTDRVVYSRFAYKYSQQIEVFGEQPADFKHYTCLDPGKRHEVMMTMMGKVYSSIPDLDVSSEADREDAVEYLEAVSVSPPLAKCVVLFALALEAHPDLLDAGYDEDASRPGSVYADPLVETSGLESTTPLKRSTSHNDSQLAGSAGELEVKKLKAEARMWKSMYDNLLKQFNDLELKVLQEAKARNAAEKKAKMLRQHTGGGRPLTSAPLVGSTSNATTPVVQHKATKNKLWARLGY